MHVLGENIIMLLISQSVKLGTALSFLELPYQELWFSSAVEHRFCISILHFQKISPLHTQERLEFPGGCGDSVRPKHLKKCMKLKHWNYQKGDESGT